MLRAIPLLKRVFLYTIHSIPSPICKRYRKTIKVIEYFYRPNA